MKFFNHWKNLIAGQPFRGFNPRRDWHGLLVLWLIILLVVVIGRTFAILSWQKQFETTIDETGVMKTIKEDRLAEIVAVIKSRAEELTTLKQAPIKVVDPS